MSFLLNTFDQEILDESEGLFQDSDNEENV